MSIKLNSPQGKEVDDQSLVMLANQGDPAAFEMLYLTHRDWCYTVALTFTNQHDADAQDVVQETFRYFIARFPDFRLTCQLRTYLYPIIRNKAIDLARSRRRRSEFIHDDVMAMIEQIPARDDPSHPVHHLNFHDLVAHLPEHLREVVILRFQDDLPLEHIANKLAIPTGTVKSRLHYALESLRKTLPALVFFLIFSR